MSPSQLDRLITQPQKEIIKALQTDDPKILLDFVAWLKKPILDMKTLKRTGEFVCWNGSVNSAMRSAARMFHIYRPLGLPLSSPESI